MDDVGMTGETLITEEISILPSLGWLLFQIFVIFCVGALVAFVAAPWGRRLLDPSIRRDHYSDHILLHSVLMDGETVRCTTGTLFKVIRIGGTDLDAIDEIQVEELFRRRKQMLFALSSSRVRVRQISMRRRLDLSALKAGTGGVEGGKEPSFISKVLQSYSNRFTASFRNEHYIILAIEGVNDAAREELEGARRQILTTLSPYNPGVLKLGKPEEWSELIEFLGSILNPGFLVRGRAALLRDMPPGKSLAQIVCQSEPDFLNGKSEDGLAKDKKHRGVVKFTHRNRETFVGAIAVSTWGDETSSDMIQRIMALESETVIHQIFDVFDRKEGTEYVESTMKSTLMAGAIGQRKQAQFQQAIEVMDGDQISEHERLCRYEFILFVHGYSASDLDARMSQAEEIFIDENYVTVRLNDDQIPFAFLGLLPPHHEPIYEITPFSSNVADFMPFSTPSQGFRKSDWGEEPIQYFHTASNAVYSFIFHENEEPLSPGHTFMFGKTGGGKTVIQNFLAISATRHKDLKAFIFDRGDASYIAVKAFGGRYFQLQSSTDGHGEICRLNPFQLDIREDMSAETNWLIGWLIEHVGHIDRKDRDKIEDVTQAIRGLARVERRYRYMESFVNALHHKETKEHFADFIEGGRHAYLFRVDANRPQTVWDTLNFDNDTQIYGFDFEAVLEDPLLTEVLLTYVYYRISKEVARTGCPWLMALDELKAMLAASPAFVEKFNNWLDEARRKRGVILGAFQFIEQMLESGTLTRITNAKANFVFLPNESATREAYVETLGASQKVFDMIKKRDASTQDLDRFIVLQRPMENGQEGAVVLKTDLSDLEDTEFGNLLCLFIGGHEPANRYREFEARYGYPNCVHEYVRQSSRARRAKVA